MFRGRGNHVTAGEPGYRMLKRKVRRLLAATGASLGFCLGHVSAAERSVELTRLDPHVPNFATFSSDVPHVATNGHGIFVVYLSHEEAGILPSNWGNLNTWVLKRSTDGGATFTTLFTVPPRYGKAPEIESDESDDIYLFDGDYSPPGTDARSTDLVVYRFRADESYRNPHIATISKEAAGKFSALYDRSRGQFYYVGFGQIPFLVLDKAGRVIRRYQLFGNGRVAGVQYPLLAMDDARLFVAWTTTPFGDCGGGPTYWHCALPVYYSSHFIYSDDGGATWQAPDGRALTLPVVSDTGGPVPNIIPKVYFGKQSVRLAGFTAQHGLVHFMFQLRPLQNEIYEAFTVSPFARVRYSENIFGPPARPAGFGAGGFGICGYDGFLTHDAAGDLYAVAQDSSKQSGAPAHSMPLVVLDSRDNGWTWSLLAHRTAAFAGAAFINGPRVVSPQYGITGVFTGSSTGSWAPNAHEAFFFRIPGEAADRPPNIPRTVRGAARK